MTEEIDRRSLLKTAGALAAGSAVGGTVPVASAHGDEHDHGGGGYRGGPGVVETGRDGPLTVTVFVSEQLHEYSRAQGKDGYHAARVAKAYIEGAIDQTDRFDVDVTVAETTPRSPAPNQGPMGSLTAPCPCYEGRRCDYRSKLLWWRARYWDGWDDSSGQNHPTTERCGEYHARAVDANLFIDRGTGGGVSTANAGRVCVADTGDRLLEADPEYQRFGYDHDGNDKQFRAIRATIHEVGHCLMDGTTIEDEDGDGDPWGPEHDMSEIIHDESTGNYAITPMGVHGDQNNEGTNEHDKDETYVHGGDEKPDGFAYFYSEATLDHFYHKPPYDITWAAGSGGDGFAGSVDDGAVATHLYPVRDGDSRTLTVELSGPEDADLDLYVTVDGSEPHPYRGGSDHSSIGPSSDETVVIRDELGAGAELGVGVHAYDGGGEYSVTVGEHSEDLEPPTAAFSVEAPAVPTDPYVFDAAESADPDGSIATYEWDFGDGRGGTGEVVEHVYDTPGEHTVDLTVTDDDGQTATASRTVAVDLPNDPPIARADVPDTADVGESITLDAAASEDPDGSLVGYEWTVDGETLTGEAAVTSFDAPGSYRVTLAVEDDRGATDTDGASVVVNDPNEAPAARIDGDDSVEVGETAEFDASASTDPEGNILMYGWTFDDGTAGFGERVSHEFDSAGDYTVELTVYDLAGAVDSATHEVTVEEDDPWWWPFDESEGESGDDGDSGDDGSDDDSWVDLGGDDSGSDDDSGWEDDSGSGWDDDSGSDDGSTSGSGGDPGSDGSTSGDDDDWAVTGWEENYDQTGSYGGYDGTDDTSDSGSSDSGTDDSGGGGVVDTVTDTVDTVTDTVDSVVDSISPW